MSIQLNSLISKHSGLSNSQSGLSNSQLNAAKDCRDCKGCYARLVQLEKDGILETFNSRAIGIINQNHPFNMELLSKYTSLEDWDIGPIVFCKNTLCKCKQVWTELKNELELRDQGVKFSSSLPYINERKMGGHAIYILENIILDPEELHGEEEALFLM